MKRYLQAVAIWAAIIPIAILNGIFRETVLVKLGELALPLSGIILSLSIFALAYFLIPKVKHCRKRDYIAFSVIWFLLTNLFDLSMIIRAGGTFIDYLKSYYFLNGNLWILVVLTSLLSPITIAKMKKLIE